MLQVHDLRKPYGARVAVVHVSLTVCAGEVLGLQAAQALGKAVLR